MLFWFSPATIWKAIQPRENRPSNACGDWKGDKGEKSRFWSFSNSVKIFSLWIIGTDSFVVSVNSSWSLEKGERSLNVLNSISSTQQLALTSAHRPLWPLLALRLPSSSATILPIDRPLLSRDLLKKLSKKSNWKGYYRCSEEHVAACQAGERCTVVGAENDQWSMQSICFGFWLRSIYPDIPRYTWSIPRPKSKRDVVSKREWRCSSVAALL